MLYLWT